MFLAVVPAPEVAEEIEEFLEPRRSVPGLRWSDPDTWHITLAFWAQVPDARYEPLTELLEQAAGRTQSFPLAVRGGGADPDPLVAKVLWLGVDDPTDRLHRLAARARTAGHRVGVPADPTAFHPHVTVARGRGGHQGRVVQALDTFAGSTWQVDRVHLVESHLGQARAHHRIVESYDLAPAPQS